MSICIECAVGQDDFAEVTISLGLGSGAPAERALATKAWINGKKHRLDNVRTYHIPCDQCGMVRSCLYTPEDE
jgi:hypothetical protein